MPSKHTLLAAAAAALAVAPAAVLAQGGTTFNNVNDIANSNSNSNNVDVSIAVGGAPAAPTTLSTRTVVVPTYTPVANSTSMTVTTTVVTAWSTYCPEPTVLWFEKERYVVTKPTMLTYKNCPCTITTKVPAHTDLPVRPAVVPVYPPAAVQPVHPVVVEPVPAAPVATPVVAAPVAPVARVGTVTHNGHYVVPTTVPVTAGAAGARDAARSLLGLAVAAGAAAVGAFAA
ncbi:hypothetical protein RB595_001719 [Gaeumannomyces hyphopodioides]